MNMGLSATAETSHGSLGVLGVWRLTQRLHQGSWAEIFAAQPADALGSPRADYVVKRVRATLEDPQTAARQICTEARVLSRIRSPHVIAVLDACVEGPSPYFTMPRLDGENLQRWLDDGRWQPLPVCLWWTRQAAQGLAALHEGGWRHGDIKPSNLMIGTRGHVTLLDLGFAARAMAPADGGFAGTPGYAAPEQFSETGEGISPAADVYSLGVMLLQLLMRQPAVSGCAGRGPLDLDVLRRAGVPAPVAEMVGAMTAADPGGRPTAAALAEQLLRLEIETLGMHIQPAAADRRLAA